MKLVHFELSGILLDEKTEFMEWIIEMPEAFSEYVMELSAQIDGGEGRFVLSEKNKELDLAKKMDIIFNPFAVDINSRKILSKLYLELSALSKGEQMYVKTTELLRYLQEYMLDLEQCTEYILEFDEEADVTALLKAVNVHYETSDMDFLERLVQYIKILAAMTGIKLFVFVNLRSYLADYQIQELIKEMKYQDTRGLFIESQQKGCMEGVKQYIIDVDRCEIY
ncbi:type II-A CRISPR-associated protein Csn2 [Blautia sp. MSJ-19]|uniref:type II-A CRISPR-associated protein Csn2 n=1 Tax=Blautia sp. MSJ-19 TaxID=2841517 RepID=UPI001C0EF7D7|nr:type II-A CRISPR-associated protein Csn2 [Blautia sp. MSJ-19]MBU5480286.1 type II-A CRISPR-associated protein Csn2 [Blautia sp. MSJ-19]